MTHFSFSEVATLWKADKRKYVRKSSYAIYSLLCNKYILPVFGDDRSLSEDSIQGFVDDMLQRGYAVKTVKDTMLVLKMILRHGEKIGAWPHLEFSVHYPTVSAAPRYIPTLSPRHLHLLLEYLKGHFSYRNLGIMLCLYSGLRIGEVCGLQWKDLDVSLGVIRVNKTVQRISISDGAIREYYISVDAPKTSSSIREIPFTAELKSIIRPLKKIMPSEYFLISNGPAPMEPRAYRDYFHSLLRRLDIPNIRFHALRHSFATRCIASRCDYKTVSVILGHSSISTTLDLYVHPGFSEKKKCIDRLSKSLEK